VSIQMTKSFKTWLWECHRDIFMLVSSFGHIELITEEKYKEYLMWCEEHWDFYRQCKKNEE